jgi:hypothetical protein
MFVFLLVLLMGMLIWNTEIVKREAIEEFRLRGRGLSFSE